MNSLNGLMGGGSESREQPLSLILLSWTSEVSDATLIGVFTITMLGRRRRLWRDSQLVGTTTRRLSGDRSNADDGRGSPSADVGAAFAI